MAAPNTAYLFGGTATFPIHIEGEIKLDSYPALFLAEYQDKIKESFYLDAFLVIDDGQGNKAFLGLVKDVPGSLNYLMHATPRWFKQRIIDESSGQAYIVMNDGGLNTKGISIINSVTSSRVNKILVNITYKSAYFVLSDEIGIYSNINGGPFEPLTERISYGEQSEGVIQSIDVSPVVYPNMKAGDKINVKSYIKNSEGETMSQLLSITLTPAIFLLRGPEAYASYAITSSQEVRDLYASTSELVGAILYRNELMTQYAPVGYYSTEDRLFWFKVGKDDQERSVVISGGEASKYDPSDPNYDAPYFEIVFLGDHSAIESRACAIASATPTHRLVYQTNPYTDGRYYADIFMTQPLFDGYFVLDVDGFNTWLKLFNGYEVERGDC